MGRKERRAMERRERKESIRMTPDRIQALKQKTANGAIQIRLLEEPGETYAGRKSSENRNAWRR